MMGEEKADDDGSPTTRKLGGLNPMFSQCAMKSEQASSVEVQNWSSTLKFTAIIHNTPKMKTPVKCFISKFRSPATGTVLQNSTLYRVGIKKFQE